MNRKQSEAEMEDEGEDSEKSVLLTCNENGVADGSIAHNMLWISVIQDTISGL